jgi:hypothetical protein
VTAKKADTKIPVGSQVKEDMMASRSVATGPSWAHLGLVVFAGVMMIAIGVFQMLQGIAAVREGEFYVVTPNYAYQIDVSTWGWIHLGIGIVLILAGIFVFSGTLWARIIGILVAASSAISNFFFIPYYTVWPILIIALDVVIIWALATYRPASEPA